MKTILISLSVFLLLGCSNNELSPPNDLKLSFPKNGTRIRNNVPFRLQFEHNPGWTFDSVVIAYENQDLTSIYEVDEEILLNDLAVGYKDINISVFEKGNIQNEFTPQVFILQENHEQAYTYEKLEELPHSRKAYTQGLEFYNDVLLESSGLYNKSYLHQLNPDNLTEIKNVAVPTSYFAEGITVLNDKLYLLTWQEHTCLVYNPNTLELIREFSYPINIEGWGLTNNGESLIMTDGTNNVYYINPTDFSIIDKVSVYTYDGTPLRFLNELEYVDGKLYANIYQSEKIAIIDPENGELEGIINLEGIMEDYYYESSTDVLNGIAYDKETGTFYVTGKNWPLMFRISITK